MINQILSKLKIPAHQITPLRKRKNKLQRGNNHKNICAKELVSRTYEELL